MEDIKPNEFAAEVIKCAEKVHDNLGNCFDKNTYIQALDRELESLRKEIKSIVKKTSKVSLFYNGKPLYKKVEVFDYSIAYKKTKILLKIDNQIPDVTVQSKENYGIVDINIIAVLAINFNSDSFEYKVLFSRARKNISCCDRFRQFCYKLCRCCLNFKKINCKHCKQYGSAILFCLLPIILVILLLYNGESEIAELLYVPFGSFFFSSIIIWGLSCEKCKYFDDPDMFEYCVGMQDAEQCFCKKNMFIWEYSVRKKWIRKAHWFIVKFILWLVYHVYLRIDVFNVLMRLCSPVKEHLVGNENKNRCLDISIDIYVFMLSIGGIIAFVCVDPNDKYFDFILCSIFIWRILTIFFIKLNEILSHTIGGMHYSFNRTFIFFMSNIIDVTIGYSFLYSSYYFNIFQERNFSAIFGTLKIFTEWSVDKSLCVRQSFLVLSQVVVVIILVSVFLTTMSNLKYMRKK